MIRVVSVTHLRFGFVDCSLLGGWFIIAHNTHLVAAFNISIRGATHTRTEESWKLEAAALYFMTFFDGRQLSLTPGLSSYFDRD